MIEASLRLRRAILLDDLPIVKRIIGTNPQLLQNPDYGDKSNTSLHIAAQAGFDAIVVFLLSAGHESLGISRNSDWDTPLMLAARHGRIEVCTLLITQFPRCIPWVNKRGLDALSLSCQNPASTPLIPLLLSHAEHPASVNSRDNHGDTPLHHASAAGSLKALRILLSAGADPMAKNAYDWTPLAYSQTVAAEVYFKNLIAEIERRKVEGAREEKERKSRHGAGVRLVTDEEDRGMVNARQAQDEDTIPSPLLKRGAFTPTLGRSGAWTAFEGNRARASSGG